jgi:chromosome segregation ATPase
MQSKSLLLLCLGLLAGPVAGANLRASNKAQAHLTATEKDADAIGNSLTLPAAMQRVVTMLENLISEMDAEEKEDDKMFEEFNAWFATQSAATQQGIDTLNAKIEEFKAILAQLKAQKAELDEEIRYLNGEIETTQTQIDQATEKRNEEHNSFVGEQQDFQNSINACNKAVEILAKHYGDGSTPQAEKPAFMSLIQLEAHLRSSSNVRGGSNGLRMLSTMVASQKANPYQDSGGEALGIVDQVKLLATTFAEDKQSAIDEENRLQKVYETLMEEKTEALRTLVEQRDRQQGVLNQVNQDIGENETGLANAEEEVANEQAYLAQITQQNKDTIDLYHMRKHDRAEERAATDQAIKILSKGPDDMSTMAFVQLRATTKLATKTGCPQCERATILLRKAARSFHSELLAVAAAAAMSGAGGEALANVIVKLEGLLKRIDEEQAMEDEHKAWCETEMSTTQQKKTEHEANVAKLTQEIADTTEVIKEKIQAIADTEDAIKAADAAYQEATQLRAEQKAAYEVELQNYKDAVSALNEAIDILAKFYAKGGALLETGVDADAAPRADAPGTFSGGYEKKGGGVVKMLSETRHEFEVGKANLIQAETEAQADYDAAEKDYRARRSSLVEAKNTFTVELQTAQNKLEQAKEDKQASEEEIASAVAYLAQLNKSCKSLLENYQDRVNMRNDEKKAINEAIGVLKEVA